MGCELSSVSNVRGGYISLKGRRGNTDSDKEATTAVREQQSPSPTSLPGFRTRTE